MQGYSIAMTASIGMGLTLRKVTSGFTKGASGNKLLMINLVVQATAVGTASFLNSVSMRYTEIKKGITVYSDSDLKNEVGVSQKCAESAVINTATSRVALGAMCLSSPVAMMMISNSLRLTPNARYAKIA